MKKPERDKFIAWRLCNLPPCFYSSTLPDCLSIPFAISITSREDLISRSKIPCYFHSRIWFAKEIMQFLLQSAFFFKINIYERRYYSLISMISFIQIDFTWLLSIKIKTLSQLNDFLLDLG